MVASTKSTIAYGDQFHLYRDVGDTNNIYLRLDQPSFDASPDQVTVTIPLHIWEFIRQHPGVDFSWVDKTDEEIHAYVEGEIDKRLAEYKASTDSSMKSLLSFAGSLSYGDIDSPREEQIRRGVVTFQEERTRQQKIRDAIDKLQSPD